MQNVIDVLVLNNDKKKMTCKQSCKEMLNNETFFLFEGKSSNSTEK